MFTELDIGINIPADHLGITFLQSQVTKHLTNSDPFKWHVNEAEEQIAIINKTLDIALQNQHGLEKTHITIFPEYSIPGLNGLHELDQRIESPDWPTDTFILAGIDGLTHEEYTNLCGQDNTEIDDVNKPENIPKEFWFNCLVFIVKGNNGQTRKWVQPKLTASWPEKDIEFDQMYCGKSIYIFSANREGATVFRIMPLICFDWISQIGGKLGIDSILTSLNNHWEGEDAKELGLVIIIQNNDEPNHIEFLQGARNFFENQNQYNFVGLNNSIIFFANNSDINSPGRVNYYGFSSIILSPNSPFNNSQGTPPSYALCTSSLRKSENLGRCVDALFRENGSCIHSFKLLMPASRGLGPSSRSWPIENVYVNPTGTQNDPRLPSQPVHAIVKWVNDELDDLPDIVLSPNNHPLIDTFGDLKKTLIKDIRVKNSKTLRKIMNLSNAYNSDEKNIDRWDMTESSCLKCVTHTLNFLSIFDDLTIYETPICDNEDVLPHATIKLNDDLIDVVIMKGESAIDCVRYFEKKYIPNSQRSTLFISDGGIPTTDREVSPSFLTAELNGDSKPDFINPASAIYHYGLLNLVHDCSNCNNIDEFRDSIIQLLKL